jgi:hypothetical protein
MDWTHHVRIVANTYPTPILGYFRFGGDSPAIRCLQQSLYAWASPQVHVSKQIQPRLTTF